MSRDVDSTPSKGEDTKERIVAHGLRLASSMGLTGVTIGELASDLGLSKSGLFAHFKSKERLQLDILDAAAEHFRAKVFLPALCVPRGEARLRAVFENWLAWVSSEELPGGCVFLAGALEWDDREGAIRDRLVSWFQALEHGVTKACRLAVEEGHLACSTDPGQFAWTMHSIVMKYHLDARLLRDQRALTRARLAFERVMRDAKGSAQ